MNAPPDQIESEQNVRTWPAALGLGIVAAGLLWFAARNSLGLWLGGFGMAAIIVPAISLHAKSSRAQWIDTAIAVDSIAMAWLISALVARVPLIDWLMCTLMLYAFSLAGTGIARLFMWLRIGAELAAAMTAIISLAWLSSPVWLSTWMNDSVADALSKSHPLLAVNSRLTELGIWFEQPLIYRHNVLGQDMSYALPSSIWPAVLVHAIPGVFLFLKHGTTDKHRFTQM